MSLLEHTGEDFYQFAMELFSNSGHISTFEPEFFNHSPERFIYFDNKSELSLSQEQRKMFQRFNNISRLFSANGCVFFSVNLLIAQKHRSQTAHDLHTMIHPLIGANGTIFLFKCHDEMLLSFIGYGNCCVLSDWYPMTDDYQILLNKLDIANISIQSEVEYFADMVYSFARSYYHVGSKSTILNLLPVDFIYRGLDQEELDQIVKDIMTAPEREYGDDYVGYNESTGTYHVDIGAEFDLMLLEMNIEDDNPFGEEIEEHEGDGFLDDEYVGESEQDIYEFDDVALEVFQDPTLMVKWLKKQESQQLGAV